jgi:5'-nucleotidase/UDP-sugar diphosphatase
MKTKKFTILHSNDMHGDFLAEIKADKNGKLIGGLSLLSGYINKVRAEEKNVLYVISGDMLQGSMIDSEYKGISTMEIMNYLAPDVVALGNHEFDYGLPHLLFLEKMANFPIVNANLYIKKYNKRLMNPYKILKKDGFEIMFTGIITEKVMDALKGDKLVGSFVSLEEASGEVGKICNAYKNDDIDLTILLTHIGYESDVELANLIKPEWGVDMIIGGHSHTVLEQPAKVNNILIAQAGVGTDQIGRFDITVDDDTNSIVDYKWQLIPIVEGIAPPDAELKRFIDLFSDEVDRKYSTLVCKFQRTLEHHSRTVETELGDVFADAFAQITNSEVALVGSGSIRQKSLGPLVTLKDYRACFPYDDSIGKFEITGMQLKKIFRHIMRTSNRQDEGECYQVNSNVRAIYNDSSQELESLSVNGLEVKDESKYTICLQGYHLNNCQDFLNITLEELSASGKNCTVTSSCQQAMEEYLKNHQNLTAAVEGRLVYKS